MSLRRPARSIMAPELEEGITLYQLNYIKANVQQFKLVRFNKLVDIEDAVRAAKQYCAINNIRFVFIEPAIIAIDLDEMENE